MSSSCYRCFVKQSTI